MPKDNVKPNTQETTQVKYLDRSVSVQTNHNWVAVSKLPFAGGESCFITSFAEKPVLLPNGSYAAQVGSDFTYLLPISDTEDNYPLLERKANVKDSKTSPEENLVKAALLLSEQLKQFIADAENPVQAAHSIYCPDHGLLPKFIDSIMDTVVEVYGNDEDEDEGDDDHHVIHVNSLSGLIAAIKAAAALEEEEVEKPKAFRFS